MKKLLAFLTILVGFGAAAASGNTFTAGDNTFLLNGEPFVVKAAELHYTRIPRPYWEHRIRMCKSLGMNTICLYVFWNSIETREGEFDFSGNNDVAHFCRLAQRNGMYVIVRPGPYVCAEWEMGGLPWWLLKKKDIRLRELDPYFMERVAIFQQKLGEQIASLTIDRGGPIIMLQVENEYGSYGESKPYVAAIRDILRRIYGDRVLMFQCDWSSNFEKNALPDLLWTMNFGTGANIDEQFRRLNEIRPNSPKMCSEFWSGWFDKWGASHETRPADAMVQGIDEMLSKGISFSLYMTHGGTSFSHWAGANSPGFAPDVTSYDYDAPINEIGQPTPKYDLLRATMAKYNQDKPLPAIPEPVMPVITIPAFSLNEFAPIECGITRTYSDSLRTFEDMDMGWGCAIYTTTLPRLSTLNSQNSTLEINVHDFARVFVDGKFIGTIDRIKNQKSLQLPPINGGEQLEILVEGMGRINFGTAINDRKGILGTPTINTIPLTDWTCAIIPDDYAIANKISRRLSGFKKILKDPRGLREKNAGYYRGTFRLDSVGDTFINLQTWGKGQAYVNGHAIGRFWSIGPQQTLFMPGCWLKKGDNEIIILDIIGPNANTVWGQDKPEYDLLQLENTTNNSTLNSQLSTLLKDPVATGNFASGNGWQTIKFNRPATGRYLCVECVSTHSGDNVTAIAELYARDATDIRISRENWTTRYADSEQLQGNHTGDKAYDLQESTYWQTRPEDTLPHRLVIDLGETRTITAIDYLPRAEKGAPNAINAYNIYLF